jgi:hypothetical protein
MCITVTSAQISNRLSRYDKARATIRVHLTFLCLEIYKPETGIVWVLEAIVVDYVWNVMAHAQKPDFVFRWNGRVRSNRRGRQFSRLLAADVCASAVVMLDTPCSEVVWRVLTTHSIRQFPLYLPSRASPCAITFQLDSTAQIRSALFKSQSLFTFQMEHEYCCGNTYDNVLCVL